ASSTVKSTNANTQETCMYERRFKHCSNRLAFAKVLGNDPSAGSPTETLLRLLLPLNDQVWASFQTQRGRPKTAAPASPKTSLNHSIGSSDGRCVQRAGT